MRYKNSYYMLRDYKYENRKLILARFTKLQVHNVLYFMFYFYSTSRLLEV